MKTAGAGVELAALALLGAILGCSGGGRPSGLPAPGIMPAPATCGTVLPCGGDLTGTWKVIGGCLGPSDGEILPCGGTVQLLTLSFGGTETFNADMTYTYTDLESVRAEIDSVPTSCPVTPTCAEEDKELKSMVPEVLSYASCTGTSTCNCTIAEDEVYSESGTYSILGSRFNTVSYYDAGGTVTESKDYCVQDGFLHVLSASYMVDSSGTTTAVVEQDVVAEKQ